MILTQAQVAATSVVFSVLITFGLVISALSISWRAFRYLRAGLSFVLIFIGVKMLVEDLVHITTGVSLIVVGGVIAVSLLASLLPLRKSPNS